MVAAPLVKPTLEVVEVDLVTSVLVVEDNVVVDQVVLVLLL
jgi:hypothetical protein